MKEVDRENWFIANQVPKRLLAELAEVGPNDISLWIRGSHFLTAEKRRAIDRTFARLTKLYAVHLPRGVTLNANDVVAVRELLDYFDKEKSLHAER